MSEHELKVKTPKEGETRRAYKKPRIESESIDNNQVALMGCAKYPPGQGAPTCFTGARLS